MFVFVLIQTIEDANGTNILDQSVIKKGKEEAAWRASARARYFTNILNVNEAIEFAPIFLSGIIRPSGPGQIINPGVLGRRRHACDRQPRRRPDDVR